MGEALRAIKAVDFKTLRAVDYMEPAEVIGFRTYGKNSTGIYYQEEKTTRIYCIKYKTQDVRGLGQRKFHTELASYPVGTLGKLVNGRLQLEYPKGHRAPAVNDFGRPRLGLKPLTNAERQARHRAKRGAGKRPKPEDKA